MKKYHSKTSLVPTRLCGKLGYETKQKQGYFTTVAYTTKQKALASTSGLWKSCFVDSGAVCY